MDYVFGLKGCTVSLAVRPLDAYTGKPPQGAYVTLTGLDPPLVKPDGYFVYTDLPDGPYSVTAGGKMLHGRTVTLSGQRVITDLLLIPDGGSYELSPGAAFAECETEKPSARFFAVPAIGDIQLTAAYEPGGGFIETSCVDYDLEGRLLAVCADNKLADILRLGQRFDERKYALRKPSANEYGAGLALSPLSLGKTDENGHLLMPMWKTAGNSGAVLYGADGAECGKLEIKHKR